MKVNSTSLLDRLNNKSLLRSAGFVAGEWVASAANGKTFDITNPSKCDEPTPGILKKDMTPSDFLATGAATCCKSKDVDQTVCQVDKKCVPCMVAEPVFIREKTRYPSSLFECLPW